MLRESCKKSKLLDCQYKSLEARIHEFPRKFFTLLGGRPERPSLTSQAYDARKWSDTHRSKRGSCSGTRIQRPVGDHFAAKPHLTTSLVVCPMLLTTAVNTSSCISFSEYFDLVYLVYANPMTLPGTQGIRQCTAITQFTCTDRQAIESWASPFLRSHHHLTILPSPRPSSPRAQ